VAGNQPARTSDGRIDPLTSGRPLTRRGASSRQRLFDATGELLDEKHFNEIRVSDITGRAGMATGSFYTYFKSKESLFRVMAEQALHEITTAPERHPDNPDRNPVFDIAHASRLFFLACHRHRAVLRSVESLRGEDGDVHLHRRRSQVSAAKRSERWIRRLQAEGTCDRSVDPWLTAMALQSMNVTLAYEHLVYQDNPDKTDSLVQAVTPIWARSVGLDEQLAEWLASLETEPPT
jgi:AcrR family transcriptional regulator